MYILLLYTQKAQKQIIRRAALMKAKDRQRNSAKNLNGDKKASGAVPVRCKSSRHLLSNVQTRSNTVV
jgi:hypothetical protein